MPISCGIRRQRVALFLELSMDQTTVIVRVRRSRVVPLRLSTQLRHSDLADAQQATPTCRAFWAASGN